jgi:hypothetical protein
MAKPCAKSRAVFGVRWNDWLALAASTDCCHDLVSADVGVDAWNIEWRPPLRLLFTKRKNASIPAPNFNFFLLRHGQ